ncbi:hypothetical protein F4780DRAFT_754094 [Xylariomycetidae sp. FL0641]|nr:hypothetical protein F4780DRAFT_754094 [Xylariomycetidae sp. FL0641]
MVSTPYKPYRPPGEEEPNDQGEQHYKPYHPPGDEGPGADSGHQYKPYHPPGEEPRDHGEHYKPYRPPGEEESNAPVELSADDDLAPRPLQLRPVKASNTQSEGVPAEQQQHPPSPPGPPPASGPITPHPDQPQQPEQDFQPPPPGPPSASGPNTPRPDQQQQQGQDFPPPPPGPPPVSGPSTPHPDTPQRQEQFYPPPPPGPPPVSTPTTPHPDQVPQHEQEYPPPPSGPPPSYQEDMENHPPSGSPSESQNKTHYPPPPPGPPPAQDTTAAYLGHYDGAGPSDSAPPPGYTDESGAGAQFTDSKPVPPALPPRPVSSQQVPQFEPPPTSPGQPQFAPPPASPRPAAATSASATTEAGPSDATSKAKHFGQKFYQWGIKAGLPINKITNKLGSEAFWPTTMDKECDKAARILKSFCKDGFYTTQSEHPPPSPGHPKTPGPSSASKVLIKIPTAAIKNAKGLAIFTTFRTGFHISGAGGSGIVMARLPDGSWSPPSGFLVHTLGAGFMVGLDIYDCVCVLNTQAAVDAFTKPRLSLGGELSVVAGPVGAGGGIESALAKGSKPVWSYMKSRGFYAGVQADGTVIIQRPEANAVFYGDPKISPPQILKGQVEARPGQTADNGTIRMWPDGAHQLIEVLKAAEGQRASEQVLREMGNEPTPGDLAATEREGLTPGEAEKNRWG